MLYAGLDLGQRQDHSAIAVVERMPQGLVVRHVERAPLGTSYPRVVARVKAVVRAGLAEGGCSLVVDATGVGAPVVDMLRGAGLGCEVTAVSITGGDRERLSGGVWNVPKKDLMGGLQVLLERGELWIARGLGEAGSLLKELVDVTGVMGGGGRIRMGADGTGEHDDLVIALEQACWRARRKMRGFGTQPLPGCW